MLVSLQMILLVQINQSRLENIKTRNNFIKQWSCFNGKVYIFPHLFIVYVKNALVDALKFVFLLLMFKQRYPASVWLNMMAKAVIVKIRNAMPLYNHTFISSCTEITVKTIFNK